MNIGAVIGLVISFLILSGVIVILILWHKGKIPIAQCVGLDEKDSEKRVYNVILPLGDKYTDKDKKYDYVGFCKEFLELPNTQKWNRCDLKVYTKIKDKSSCVK